MDSKVIVCKGEDPYQTTKRALKGFSLSNLRGRKVLIKPNGGRLAFPGQGVTTHPSVVSATIDHLREEGIGEIVIGESCIFGVSPEEAFQLNGLKKISEDKGVELIDLDQTEPMEISIPGGRLLKAIRVSALLKNFDLIISIPVMKTHMHTQVSLSIKNMKGMLWRGEKVRLHQLQNIKKTASDPKELDVAISEMATVLFPDLVIIDGSVGMEGMGPAYGRRKEVGLILVGNNPLSTDAVASRLMGFDPEKIPHLKLSEEKGLGEIQPEKILISPEDYLKWENPFEPPPTNLSFHFPGIVIHDEGSCSACLSTLLVFLLQEYQKIQKVSNRDGEIHIGIGRYLKNFPNGTLLIGNCTTQFKKRGTFIGGCPPVPSQIMRKLLKRDL
ncbi:MAG: DUF362 domain-containing protein [Thermodesulfobacteriota bacterium]